MVNPMRSISLDNKYYNFVAATYHEDVGLKNGVVEAQNGRQFNSVLGKTPETFTLTLALENTKYYNVGDSVTGVTTWLGISQLADLKNYVGANGASMPLTFVSPYGVTYLVVPSGKIGVDIFNSDNPQSAGAEFRITISLESI
jgi:hypothetical protein